MSQPIRQHWWPKSVQINFWTDGNGTIRAIKRDGTVITTRPEQIAVEGHLYTVTHEAKKNYIIENWFAEDIEDKINTTIKHILTLPRLLREPATLTDLQKEDAIATGIITRGYRETIHLNAQHRVNLGLYIVSSIVRSSAYVEKLRRFHLKHEPELSSDELQNRCMNSMLHSFDLYKDRFPNSHVWFTLNESKNDFLYSDAGIVVDEPWTSKNIPFNLVFPLTPRIAVTVLAARSGDFGSNPQCILSRFNSRGVSLLNRKTVGEAKRFVFCRSSPPIEFIKTHFGKPAPHLTKTRWHNGRVEVRRVQQSTSPPPLTPR